MSLIRQLWIAVAVMMTVAFLSSFMVSTYKAKAYFEEQLLLKNIDNASSLALTLSQIDKDPITIELLISAQFDTGHYQRIELISPDNEVLQSKIFDGELSVRIPAWFEAFANLEVEPGVAQVQDGWFQYGTLFVESHAQFAYQALWETTRDLFLWFLFGALAAGLLGTVILKYITRPLADVVDQAESIGRSQFIQIPVPKTLEFSRVVKAMNTLSDKVKQMLDKERDRLEEMRYRSQHDSVTQLANREYFMNQLDSILQQPDKEARNSMILIRIMDLVSINAHLGFQKTNQLLCEIAELLNQLGNDEKGLFSDKRVGRLNGSDFAVLFTDMEEVSEITPELMKKLAELTANQEEQVNIPVAATVFTATDKKHEILVHLDGLLARAEQNKTSWLEQELLKEHKPICQSAEEWRQVISEVVLRQEITFESFPVMTFKGELVHQEALIRMEVNGRTCAAGSFIPWARRLELLADLDVVMVIRMLNLLSETGQALNTAVNISSDVIARPAIVNRIIAGMKQAPENLDKLWLEVTENCVIKHPEEFKYFCSQLKPLGCKVGIEHAGSSFSKVANLQELGLDYIKIDRAFLADVKENVANQNFVRGLTALGHSIGLIMIAEGVQHSDELDMLEMLGLDAATGPGVNHLNVK